VSADPELAVVGDDDGLAQQAFGLDRPCTAVSLAVRKESEVTLEIDEAERKLPIHAENKRSMAGELVDDVLRQVGRAHRGDRRPVDDVAGRIASRGPRRPSAICRARRGTWRTGQSRCGVTIENDFFAKRFVR
jgi:hypothetical protein